MAGCIRGGYKRRLLQTLNSPYINQTPATATAPRERVKRVRSRLLSLSLSHFSSFLSVYNVTRGEGVAWRAFARQCKRMDGCINGDVRWCIDAKVINNLGPERINLGHRYALSTRLIYGSCSSRRRFLFRTMSTENSRPRPLDGP